MIRREVENTARCAFVIVCTLLVVAVVGPRHAGGQHDGAQPKAVNLLHSASAKLERTTALGVSTTGLKGLTDDRPSTAVEIPVTGGIAIDLVYGFGGEPVSPERLVVLLPGNAKEHALPVEVEILASTLSPHAGFRSLRVDALERTSAPQEFLFRPTAAKWITIRLTPSRKAKRIVVAEIKVLGHPGPPQSHYAFKESPAKALKVLEKLGQSVQVRVTADEKQLFRDANDGQLNEWSFAEAVLVASGAADRPRRRAYLKKIDDLEEAARKALARATTPFEKGEKLLAWLHETALSKGYVAHQTDLCVVLDEGTFNCVSSATLYNVVARRLGLDARVVEVPDHAFSIVYDGTQHADVETTTPHGFNPARDPAAQREFEEKTGFRYIPDRHRDKRREIGETGLAAIIYYNHGVSLSDQKKYPKALTAYFRALSLDPESASAVKNVLAVLTKWSAELAEDGKHEEAIRVVQTGLELAPKDLALINNHEAIWSQWAQATIDSRKYDQALRILRRAAKAIPNGNFDGMEAWVFIRPAEQQIEGKKWDEALTLAASGLKKLDGKARGELHEWRTNVFLRWFSEEVEAERFDQALAVLEKGLAAEPREKRLLHNFGYLAQEWSWSVYKDAGIKKAESLLDTLTEKFEDLPDLQEVAANFAVRAVNDLVESSKFEEAVDAATRSKSRTGEERFEELVTKIYYDWSSSHTENADWEEAVALYERAVKQFPENETLKLNSIAVWDRWAGSLIGKKNWSKAAAVYKKAMNTHPGVEPFRQNLGYVAQKWSSSIYESKGAKEAEKLLASLVKDHPKVAEVSQAAENYVRRVVSKHLESEKYDDALATIDRNRGFLTTDGAVRKQTCIVYDTWALAYVDKKEWAKATKVYAKALKQLPKETHLTSNAVAIWDQWARTCFAKKDWKAAIEVYNKALVEFPGHGLLEGNREYCRQQLGG